MKLLAKFNLIFLAVLGVALGLSSWLANDFLQREAKRQVIDQAKLMMETMLSTRTYTSKQIQPLLAAQQHQSPMFIPQTVPAYSATEVFNYLHGHYADYFYKEATLNPTNPRDRAVEWEADVVNDFRAHPEKKEFIGERDTPSGRSLFLARPLRITDPTCLECHSTPDKAPHSMLQTYPSRTGFDWQLNEVIGAQIVSVPEAVPIRTANEELGRLLIYLAIIAVVTLFILDAVLVATVIRPVAAFSALADEISQGNLQAGELPVKGRDEIAVLAASFNRMRRSLERAMKMLDDGEG
jgi:protein-histidine pros-kinase